MNGSAQAAISEHSAWLASGKPSDRPWLGKAAMSGANLHHANLHRATLYRASLVGANLYRASLVGSSLVESNLAGADLFEATLAGADLSDADMSGTNLAGADLSDAILVGTCLDPAAKVADATRKILAAGFTIDDDGTIIGYRTRRSLFVGETVYSDGERYVAPFFSVCPDTECHPGLYFSTLDDARCYGRVCSDIIMVRVAVSDVCAAGGKFRCRAFTVIGGVSR